MLKITCPDGIDLKFMDENAVFTIEDGELTVKNARTHEILIHLEEGKWTDYVYTPGESTITA